MRTLISSLLCKSYSIHMKHAAMAVTCTLGKLANVARYKKIVTVKIK